jgi:hypothetical protein
MDPHTRKKHEAKSQTMAVNVDQKARNGYFSDDIGCRQVAGLKDCNTDEMSIPKRS